MITPAYADDLPVNTNELAVAMRVSRWTGQFDPAFFAFRTQFMRIIAVISALKKRLKPLVHAKENNFAPDSGGRPNDRE